MKQISLTSFPHLYFPPFLVNVIQCRATPRVWTSLHPFFPVDDTQVMEEVFRSHTLVKVAIAQCKNTPLVKVRHSKLPKQKYWYYQLIISTVKVLVIQNGPLLKLRRLGIKNKKSSAHKIRICPPLMESTELHLLKYNTQVQLRGARVFPQKASIVIWNILLLWSIELLWVLKAWMFDWHCGQDHFTKILE